MIALRFEAPLRRGRGPAARGGGARSPRSSPQVARGRRTRCATRRPAQPRPSRAGDVMVLAPPAHPGAPPRGGAGGGAACASRSRAASRSSTARRCTRRWPCCARSTTPRTASSLVAALRSSFFGVSDRDIVAYALSGGPLWIGRGGRRRCRAAAALGPALRLLARAARAAHARLRARAARAALRRDARPGRAHRHAARRGRRSRTWRRWPRWRARPAELGVLTLRGFARLLEERIRDRARGARPARPRGPGDPDTVRILSIHKAKGLEAPVVVLYDTADDCRTPTDSVALWDEGTIAIGFRARLPAAGLGRARAAEEKARAWAEARRLLYVACTRARDLLVIPRAAARRARGAFWKDLRRRACPRAATPTCAVVDAEHAAARPSARRAARDLRALAGAEGGDARGRALGARSARSCIEAARASGRSCPSRPRAPRARTAPPARSRRRAARRPRLRQPGAPDPRVDPARRRDAGAARARDGGGPGPVVRPRRRRRPRAPATPRERALALPVMQRARAAARRLARAAALVPRRRGPRRGRGGPRVRGGRRAGGRRLQDRPHRRRAGARPGRAPRAAAPALRPRPGAGAGPAGARAPGAVHGPRPQRSCLGGMLRRTPLNPPLTSPE